MSRAPIRYVRGDYKVVCDACGKRYLASQLRQRWDGLMVCPSDYEVRQPQDFVRARVDNLTVPFLRKEPQDSFSSAPFCSYVTVQAAADIGTADCAGADYNPGFTYQPAIPSSTSLAGAMIGGFAVAGTI